MPVFVKFNSSDNTYLINPDNNKKNLGPFIIQGFHTDSRYKRWFFFYVLVNETKEKSVDYNVSYITG